MDTLRSITTAVFPVAKIPLGREGARVDVVELPDRYEPGRTMRLVRLRLVDARDFAVSTRLGPRGLRDLIEALRRAEEIANNPTPGREPHR